MAPPLCPCKLHGERSSDDRVIDGDRLRQPLWEEYSPTVHGANMLETILIIVLILALIGAFPRWRYSSGWGYGPSGIIGVLLIVALVLAVVGRI